MLTKVSKVSRRVRTLESCAASRFPPIAQMRRPIVRRVVMNVERSISTPMMMRYSAGLLFDASR